MVIRRVWSGEQNSLRLKIEMFNDAFFEDLFNDKVDPLNEPLLQLDAVPHSPNSYPRAGSDGGSFGFGAAQAVDGCDPFFTSSQDGSEAKSNEELPGKYARRSRGVPGKARLEPSSAELRKQIRAEKNKKYAKESRDRKRKYVEELEAQVEALKSEVEGYKVKLKEYELIEKHKKSVGYELYDLMAKVYQDLNANKECITNNAFFIQSLKNAFCQALEEQKTLLEMLTKNIVEVMLPLPTRVSLWMAENNVDVSNPDKVAQAFGTVLNPEQVKTMVDYMKVVDPTGKLRVENNLFVIGCSKRMKAALKELVDSHRKLKLLLHKIKNYIINNEVPIYTPYIAEMMARLSTEIAANSEIKNCGITQLLEGMTITKEEEENDKEAEAKI